MEEKKERMAGGGLSMMVVVLPCDERVGETDVPTVMCLHGETSHIFSHY